MKYIKNVYIFLNIGAAIFSGFIAFAALMWGGLMAFGLYFLFCMPYIFNALALRENKSWTGKKLRRQNTYQLLAVLFSIGAIVYYSWLPMRALMGHKYLYPPRTTDYVWWIAELALLVPSIILIMKIVIASSDKIYSKTNKFPNPPV